MTNIGISALAAGGVFLGGTLAAPADMSKGGGGRYVLPVKFGLGGVPLGNEFEVVSDQDAYKTLEGWNFRKGHPLLGAKRQPWSSWPGKSRQAISLRLSMQ